MGSTPSKQPSENSQNNKQIPKKKSKDSSQSNSSVNYQINDEKSPEKFNESSLRKQNNQLNNIEFLPHIDLKQQNLNKSISKQSSNPQNMKQNPPTYHIPSFNLKKFSSFNQPSSYQQQQDNNFGGYNTSKSNNKKSLKITKKIYTKSDSDKRSNNSNNGNGLNDNCYKIYKQNQNNNNSNTQNNNNIQIKNDKIKIVILGTHTAVGKSTLLRNFIEQEVNGQHHNPTLGIDFQITQFFVYPTKKVTFQIYEVQNSEQVWEKIPSADIYFLIFDEFNKETKDSLKSKIEQIRKIVKIEKPDIFLVGNDKLDMKITGRETFFESDFVKEVSDISIINFNFLKEVNDLFISAYNTKLKNSLGAVDEQLQQMNGSCKNNNNSKIKNISFKKKIRDNNSSQKYNNNSTNETNSGFNSNRYQYQEEEEKNKV